VSVVLAVAALVIAVLQRTRIDRLERQLAAIRRDLDEVRRTVAGPRNEAAGDVAASPAPGVVPPTGAWRDHQPPALPSSPPAVRPAPTVERDLIGDLTARATTASASAGDVETRIGERWLLYAGIVVLLLGVTFFLRYAFDRNWLSPTVRVLLGAAFGCGLIGGGRSLARAGYQIYGWVLCGAGVLALYLVTYAALNFYFLLSPTAAFVLFVLITAVAAWLADREQAPALAVLAVGGGYAVPFLVGGSEDSQLVLFTYDALLVAATTFLAFRRDWWYLTILSLFLTGATVAAWAAAFYTSAKALRTELFLTLYCVLFLLSLRAALRSKARYAQETAAVLLLAPLMYHIASVAILDAHGVAFFVYLILATTAVLIVATRADLPVLAAAGWLGVALPMAMWLVSHASAAWIVPAATTVLAIYAVHLASQLYVVRQGAREPGPYDIALIHGNGVGVFAGLYLVFAEPAPHRLALLAALTALWSGVVAGVVRRWAGAIALHWAAVAGTLLAIAIALQFDAPWIVVMWGVEGGAIVLLAMRFDREWLRIAGWTLLAIAVFRWCAADVQETSVSFVPLLNARAGSALLLIGLLYKLAAIERRRTQPSAPWRRHEQTVLNIAASLLTVVAISTDVNSYWELRGLQGGSVELPRQAMLSAAWALYAAGAIAIGMRKRYAPIRYFAIALFALTLGKVFLVDLATLGGIYRVLAFLFIGVLLLFASFLYQRRRRTTLDSPR
jgi:uncharacterized membrane protein